MKDVGQPVRVALTGRTASPGLFQVLVRARARRLARAARRAPRETARASLIAVTSVLLLAPAVHAASAPRRARAGSPAFLETLKPLLPIPRLAHHPAAGVAVLPRHVARARRGGARASARRSSRKGKTDPRPARRAASCARVILTMQEYYGGRGYFEQQIYPWIAKHYDAERTRHDAREVRRALRLRAGGPATRIVGYVLPFVVWKIVFRKDSLLDLGLRTKGFFDHVVDLRRCSSPSCSPRCSS